MVWWIIYPSNLHFTVWRGLHIFLQLSLEFVTEVMFVPSVHQKIFFGLGRRGCQSTRLNVSCRLAPSSGLFGKHFGLQVPKYPFPPLFGWQGKTFPHLYICKPLIHSNKLDTITKKRKETVTTLCGKRSSCCSYPCYLMFIHKHL